MADEELPDPGKNDPESASVISYLELDDDMTIADWTINSVADPVNFTTMATTLTSIPPENIVTTGRSSESVCSMDPSPTQNVSSPVNLPDDRPRNDPNESGPPERKRKRTPRYHREGRGPQICNRCMQPRKGHTCPFRKTPLLRVASKGVKAMWKEAKKRADVLRKNHETGSDSRKNGTEYGTGSDSRKRGKYNCPDCGHPKALHLCPEVVDKVMATINEEGDTDENDDQDLEVDGEDEPGIDQPFWPRDDDDDKNGSDPSGGPIAV